MPVTSEVTVCNLALADLNAELITALDEDSAEAIQCNLKYEVARDAVLRAHPWNFALGRVAIASSTDVPVFEFTKTLPLPSDCLRVLKTNEDDEGFTWKVEGRNIVCNSSSLKILYIKAVSDVGQFDSLFVMALAARLAAMLAYPLLGDREVQGDMWEIYKQTLTEARGIDSQEGTPEALLAEDWELSRVAGYGFSRFDNPVSGT